MKLVMVGVLLGGSDSPKRRTAGRGIDTLAARGRGYHRRVPTDDRARVLEREKNFYNSRSEGSYDRLRDWISRSIGEFSSYHELDGTYDPTGRHVLDYGCGQGRDAVSLVQRGAAHVTGVADRTTFVVADAHATAFEDDAFDLVIGNSILHHLDVEVALREIRRILRPGGTAAFVEPLAANPILKVGRALTPGARTDDEHPFTEADWATCARVFDGFTHFEREFLTIPLMPLNLVLPAGAQKSLAKRVKGWDERLLATRPRLRPHARVTFLLLR
jgi:ubiquinone/menaquinone biosynthesis C-methylase UbiE